MTKIVSSFSAVVITLFALLHAGAAQAQFARTWVSGGGSDTNPCTRASPCATFTRAYNQTTVGGEIDVLDSGDFGFLSINHAITVANDGAGTAGITPSYYYPAVDINAGSTDAVVLRGLSLNGVNSANPGIYFQSGGSLLIDHCNIQGFWNDAGILFSPGANPAKLWVMDTVLSNDGHSGSASVYVVPVNGATVTAHFERVQILHAAGNGIRVDGTQGGGAIDVGLHDVTVDGATGGSGIVAVSAPSGGAAVSITGDNVTSSHNAGYGLRAVGATASVFLSRSTITNNSVGIRASSGGTITSYSDNRFANNAGGDGSPTATMSLK
jgi:hypothetical protein